MDRTTPEEMERYEQAAPAPAEPSVVELGEAQARLAEPSGSAERPRFVLYDHWSSSCAWRVRIAMALKVTRNRVVLRSAVLH
jgi:hypothetical protein